MQLIYKIIFYLWICAAATRSEKNEANSEISKQEGRSIYATHNSCGGYVEVNLDQTVVIEYKPGEEYDNDEFCVWEIRTGDCSRALITKTTSGFETGYDFLQISEFNRTLWPPSHTYLIGNTTGMEQVNLNGDFGFVVFSTDYSNTGTGFRLEIVGYVSRSRRVYEDFVTVSPIGSVTLRPYYNNMTQSYLIVPKLKTIDSLMLDIDYVLDEIFHYLSVYSMERNGQKINFRQHVSLLRGNGSASFQTDYYTNFIVLFFSDEKTIPAGGGYELNWYVPDGHPTESYA